MEEVCNYPFRCVPYKHQLVTWQRSRDLEAFALYLDMGTGKTKVTIDTAAWLFDCNKIDSLVVLAPKGVYRNWADAEIPAHLPAHISYKLGCWTAEGRKADAEQLQALLAHHGKDMRILLMNIEALGRDLDSNRAYAMLETFLKRHRALLVVDESTTIKNPKALRTKAVMKLRQYAPFRRVLSGQPAPNGPLDLYSQFEFLGEGLLGFYSFFSFKSRYAQLVKMSRFAGQDSNGNAQRRSFFKIAGYRNVEELHNRISPLAAIVKKEDCLDLPPKVFQVRLVGLGAKQKKAYEQMRKMAIVEIERSIDPEMNAVQEPFGFHKESLEAGLEDKSVETANAVSTANLVIIQMLRLHQILCGYIVTDDKKVEKFDEQNPRLEALMDALAECSGKVVIWATYRLSVEEITKRIAEEYGPESVACFYGPTDQEERRRINREFQVPDSDLRFIVANKTGARGNTWTAAHTAIYYSYDPDLDTHDQSQDRIHRIGQTVSCTYIFLSAGEGTVDEKFRTMLTNKQALGRIISASNWREYLS